MFYSGKRGALRMYVVFAEELEDTQDPKGHLVETLEQAFAQICCRCGLAYAFEQDADGWLMRLTDVERPDRSPDPVRSDYKRPRDAKHNLLSQAVDGRIRGHIAISYDAFEASLRKSA